MTSTETRSFDLAEELVQQLEQEFGPEALRGELQSAFSGDTSGVPSKTETEELFADFGRRWMERTLELGEQHTDRTYEVLKQAAERIDELTFPFLSQRFIEIAYLSTQPIYTLPVVENGAGGLVFRMPFCGYFTAVKEVMGEKFANELHCKSACLTACRKAFEHFGFKVGVKMDAAVPAEEFCQFSIRKV